MYTRLQWLTVGMLWSLCGCNRVAVPPAIPIAGTFVLMSVGGQALPYVSSSPTLPIESRLLADTMVFAVTGTGTWSSASITRNKDTNIETQAFVTLTFRHVRDGDRVMLDSLECGVNCGGIPRQVQYTLRANGLDGQGVPAGAQYERVSP